MEYHISDRMYVLALCVGFLFAGCQSKKKESQSTLSWDVVQDTTQRVATIKGGLKGPETVLYDEAQDVYFISNYNGGGMDADSNGFIARARPDGTVDSLHFMSGTVQYPFHAGHGMAIVGDTLFVAGRMGVHGFNRHTGKHLSYTDFSQFNPRFLNDIAPGPDGALYITDTNTKNPGLYHMAGGNLAQVDTLSYPPNGIAYDKDNKKLIIDTFKKGEHTFMSWDPIHQTEGKAGQGKSSLYDGIEMAGRNFIVSAQADSTLEIIRNGKGQTFVKVAGAPANIALDTKRRQVAVPYVALNRVDIWKLPKDQSGQQ